MAPGGSSLLLALNDDMNHRYNTSHLSYFRASDQDLALDNSLILGVILDSGSYLAIHVSPFLTTPTSPELPLSPTNEPFCLSLYSISQSCTYSP